MSSQEMKMREKGKEIVTFDENPKLLFHKEEVSMHFNEQRIKTPLEVKKETTLRENFELGQDMSKKIDTQEKSGSSSSKIIPYIFYTSDDKARLRWSSDLHDCFVNAVEKLGGPQKATPKNVKDMMEVEGIALHHVKSHLQKFRLGKCNIREETELDNKRLKPLRSTTKTYVSSNTPRPKVNIKPKDNGVAKPKKTKEVEGSLYMLIEHDLYIQRCREAQRMQMAFALQNQGNPITQQPTSQNSYQFLEREKNGFAMNISKQPSTIFPKTTTSNIDFCNEKIASLSMCDFNQHNSSNTCSMYYEPQYAPMIHPTQGNIHFHGHHNYDATQGFINPNPYMTIEPQHMSNSYITTTNQQCLLNDDSYCNATLVPTVESPIIDSLHQGASSNTTLFSTTPSLVHTNIPHQTYISYPPYSTLEVAKTQLNALQHTSSTSQNRETTSRGTSNLSFSLTRDEEDLVDKYIDWSKVEERDIDQPDQF